MFRPTRLAKIKNSENKKGELGSGSPRLELY